MNSPYQLVLLRHGESVWNKENLFTGWRDVPLSEKGEAEARDSGRVLKEAGFAPDLAFTSVLTRAIKTLWLALEEMDRMWIPITDNWRLNERHYGALQGKNKLEAVKKFGEAQVKIWRRSYATPPPPVDVHSALDYPKADPRYAGLTEAELPRCESLKDVLTRVLPYWESAIMPELRAGKHVLVAAHGNSLRALMKHLENISDEEIVGIDLPTGIPRAYKLNPALKVADVKFLGDPEKIKARIETVKAQTKKA